MAKRVSKKAMRGQSVAVAENGHRPGGRRFEVYVIDSGWKTEASQVVQESLELFIKYLPTHEVYVLSADQSEEFLQGHPQLLGKDPIIAVLDREAISRKSHKGIGARLLLGRIYDKHRVQSLLKMLLRIVNTRHLAEDLPGSIRREVHREGVSGAIEVIMSTTIHLEAESGH
jgi:hypothetical protein